MSQYHSRKTAKVVKPTTVRTEWQEQLAFCKWLKIQYPEVRFRSDIQSAGKLSPAMQNIKSTTGSTWRAAGSTSVPTIRPNSVLREPEPQLLEEALMVLAPYPQAIKLETIGGSTPSRRVLT